MAKTKKQQPILSPSKYIRLKARDLIPCGDYPTVEKSILNHLNLPDDYPLPDIYQRYRQYEESWK